MAETIERNATLAQTGNQPRLMDRVRASMRVAHYALSTERSYCHWIRRYILHHGKRHPADMGAAEVEAFLSYLATAENVSAKTQNQAMHAVLYLYKRVLGVDLPWLDGITRARESKRIPVVLTQHPYTSRMQKTQKQHEARALEVASIAVFSILRDWIKGQIMAVETGVMSFDGAFLGQIMLPNGKTVLEHASEAKLLPPPKEE